jgi:hypothetical protein
MFISGMTFGLTRGWNLALCILGVSPIIVIMTYVTTIFLQRGFEESLKSYG